MSGVVYCVPGIRSVVYWVLGRWVLGLRRDLRVTACLSRYRHANRDAILAIITQQKYNNLQSEFQQTDGEGEAQRQTRPPATTSVVSVRIRMVYVANTK